MHDISKNLKKLRLRQNWTQQQMADVLFVTRQAVSNWETGKTMPDLLMLENIAEKLDVSVEEILYGQKAEKEIIKKDMNKVKKLLLTAVTFYIVAVPLMVGTFMYDWNVDIFLIGSYIYMGLARPLLSFAVGIFVLQTQKRNGRIKRNIPLPYSRYIRCLIIMIFVVNFVLIRYLFVDTAFYMMGIQLTMSYSLERCITWVGTAHLTFLIKGFGFVALLRFFVLGLLFEFSYIGEENR